MNIVLAVALGSAAGGVSRYFAGNLFASRIGGSSPTGTLLINVLGSFFVGVILARAASSEMAEWLRAGLAIGFCGGFTTFSAFSYETMSLLAQGRYGKAALYAGGSVVLCVLATFAGAAARQAMS